jgi:hypothetical protein
MNFRIKAAARTVLHVGRTLMYYLVVGPLCLSIDVIALTLESLGVPPQWSLKPAVVLTGYCCYVVYSFACSAYVRLFVGVNNNNNNNNNIYSMFVVPFASFNPHFSFCIELRVSILFAFVSVLKCILGLCISCLFLAVSILHAGLACLIACAQYPVAACILICAFLL